MHINVGTGEDLSIRELAETVRDVDLPDGRARRSTPRSPTARRASCSTSADSTPSGGRTRRHCGRASRTTYQWYLEHETDLGTDRVPLTLAPMLTILSTPKAFTGLFAVIQRNAIESWTKLEPRPEIILFGRDAGTAEICDELGLRPRP